MTDYQWPTSFNKIATAVSFSPTALAVLHEAIRITRRFSGFIYFIHAGAQTPETEKKLVNSSAERLRRDLDDVGGRLRFGDHRPHRRVRVVPLVHEEGHGGLSLGGATRGDSPREVWCE